MLSIRHIAIFSLVLLCSSLAFSASVRKLNYSGRLTSVDGKPVSGPIDLQVQFYRVSTGGLPVPVLVPIFEDVNLVQGVFEIAIDLSAPDMNTVFDGNAVFIQLTDTTNGKVYPRQEFSVIPYALKVPVDEETISYNTDGELVINSVKSDQIDDGAVTLGKIAACANADEILKWDGSAWVCAPDEIGASGTGDITSVSSENGLTGGAATGDITLGIAANGVTTNRLADAAVETVKIADGAVTSDKLANSSVSADKIINAAVGTDKIADGAVTVGKLAACANADEILKWNGSAWACAADSAGSGDVTGITANDGLSGGGANGDLTIGIAANGVTTNRLADAAVETAKIADAAVSSDKLANASVSSDKIINAAVGTDKIADAAITVGKLAACANTDEILKWNGTAWVCAEDEIGASGTGDITAVTAADGLSGGGTTGDLNIGIAANGVTTNRLADAAVETAKIADAAVNSDKLANSAVGTDKIADAAITVGKLAACANADEILKWNGTAWACAADADTNAGGDVTAVTAADGLTGGGTTGDLNIGIAANGVTTNRLADAAVETDKLANGAVTPEKIAACANADEILKWNGTAWGCAADADTNAGGGITAVVASDGLSGGGTTGDLNIGIATNGVTTNRLADAAVETAKIADAAVNSDKLANASVSADKIINAAVGTDKIADAAITVGKLAACDNSGEILKWNGTAWVCAADADTNTGGDITGVAAADGLSGGGTTGDLNIGIAANGVTTNRIADAAVETGKIANAAVSSDKIADAAVTLGKLAACANTDEILKWNGTAWVCAEDEIGASGTGDITAVTAADGLSGGGTTGDLNIGIAANGVTTNRLADAAVETDKLANGAVTLAKIAACDNADEILKWNGTAWTCGADVDTNSGGDITGVTAGAGLTGTAASGEATLSIADEGVTSGKIANAAVINDKLANASVSSDKIINSAVGTDKIADGAVTVEKISACDNSGEILKWNGSAWACAADADTNDGGDITAVTAADGLSGGGTTGDLNIGIAANGVTTNRLADAAVETAKIANNAITDAKLANGAVTTAKIAACDNSGEILKWNGTAWACAQDADTNSGGDVTGLTANDGLTGGGDSGALTVGIAVNGVTTNRIADVAVETAKIANNAVTDAKLANGAVTLAKIAACANADEILKWNGSAWTCGTDANAGGDITGVTAGTGLSGGGSSGAVTVDLDISELTAESSVADNDLIPIYDTSASAHKKMTRSDLTSGLERTTNKGAASGYASLNASTKVVQDPANAQTTPASGKIPMTGAGTTLDKDWLPAMVGDSGSGGSKGAVPAPAAGDTAAGKYLKADGTWAAPFATSFTQNDSQYIATDEIRARDTGGLKLMDAGGNGIEIQDGGSIYAGRATATVYGASWATALPLPYSLQLRNTSGTTGAGSFILLGSTTSPNSNVATAYIGAVSVTGKEFTPATVFGRRTASGTHAESMRIDENGYVGIGTLSPGIDLVGTYDYPATTKILQVDAQQPRIVARGSTDAALDLIDTGAATDNKWMQLNNTNGLTKFWSVNDTGGALVNNIIAMQHSNGNVGLGTATPDNKLHVHSTTNNSQIYLSSAAPSLAYGNAEDIANRTQGAEVALATANGHYVTGATAGDLILRTIQAGAGTAKDIILANGTSEKMRVQADGDVGIGVASPAAKLDVNGNTKIGGNSRPAGHYVSMVDGYYVSGSRINVAKFSLGIYQQAIVKVSFAQFNTGYEPDELALGQGILVITNDGTGNIRLISSQQNASQHVSLTFESSGTNVIVYLTRSGGSSFRSSLPNDYVTILSEITGYVSGLTYSPSGF